MELLSKIKEKCDRAGLQTKLTTRLPEMFDDDAEERTELSIQIPLERETKTVYLNQRYEFLQTVFESDFEKYKFLRGYEAIYSIELGTIECEIQSDDIIGSSGSVFRRLSRFLFPKEIRLRMRAEEIDEENYSFEFPSPNENLKIKIGVSSNEFSILSGNKRDTVIYARRLKKFSTIRLEGVKFETHNQAKEIMLTIANSVFFQIDLVTNIPVRLALDRNLLREIRIRKKDTKETFQFFAPKFKYDEEAISLYWYARTAVNMPLLQFLAFYQVLEFYFPQYSYKEAQEKIKNLLKDPTFDRNSDKNVARILDIVKVSSRGKSIGDERNQIRATIQCCIGIVEMNDFFNGTEERRDFFDEQKKSKSFVNPKISFNRNDHDIRMDVSNRIYNLRCRIVHTKDESDIEMLLPFSQDLAYLKYDIDLIEFIARKVLIASCKHFDIKF